MRRQKKCGPEPFWIFDFGSWIEDRTWAWYITQTWAANPFWILDTLDFRFWIEDRTWGLVFLRGMGGVESKSKIQNPK
jgi:hypothetical protein